MIQRVAPKYFLGTEIPNPKVYAKKIDEIIDAINSLNSSKRPYKVYTALLTQVDTDAPTAVVLENTIGDIVWSRSITGSYEGTLNSAFTLNKTVCFAGKNFTLASPAVIPFDVIIDTYGNVNKVTLNTATNSGVSDDKLNNTPIEIRVYN